MVFFSGDTLVNLAGQCFVVNDHFLGLIFSGAVAGVIWITAAFVWTAGFGIRKEMWKQQGLKFYRGYQGTQLLEYFCRLNIHDGGFR